MSRRTIFDKEEAWKEISKTLPTAAAVASIFFDGFSMWFTLRSNLIAALSATIVSTVMITIAVWGWIERRGTGGQDEEYMVRSRYDSYFFKTAGDVIYRREMTIVARRELKAITVLLSRGHGREQDFVAVEQKERRGKLQEVKLHTTKQYLSGRPALIITRDTPLKPKEKCTISIESRLIGAFPDCNSEGVSVDLPSGLEHYQLRVSVPKEYFKGLPLLQWFKLHRELSSPLDQGEVEGQERGGKIEFFVDLSEKLNSNLRTEFAFVWRWKLPPSECTRDGNLTPRAVDTASPCAAGGDFEAA